MKKIGLLFLLLGLLAPCCGASTFTKVGRYYYPSVRYPYTSRNANTEFVQALFSGTSLYTGRLPLVATPVLKGTSLTSYLDPYIVAIDGKNYVLVKDSKTGEWTVDNILGAGDSKTDLFASLKNLESDGDSSKITADELKKANIRFVLLNSDESLALNDRNSDYSLDNVLYIDMKNLRTSLGNKNQDGTFGYFYVMIQPNNIKRAVPGRVTFEEKQELNKYIK